jgi:hypothetical protein
MTEGLGSPGHRPRRRLVCDLIASLGAHHPCLPHQVIDRGDGSYAINFSASVPGDYRMQARLENVELPTVNLQVRDCVFTDERRH